MATKAEATRARLVEVVLHSLDTRGYKGTTMRAIAEDAGVSVGNAYYHFASKDELVQVFYERAQAEHAALVRAGLAEGQSLAQRIELLWRSGLDSMRPHRTVCAELLPTIVTPRSTTTPLAPSDSQRSELDLIREVVDGATGTVPKVIREVLPELLWLGFLGVMLSWLLADDEVAEERAELLISQGSALIADLVPLTRLPVLRGAVAKVVRLYQAVSA